MTKAELIARVSAKKGLPRDLTKKTVAQIIDAMFTEVGDYFIREKSAGKSAGKSARTSARKSARASGAKLTYPGFGTFSKRRRPGRVVKNPQNGAPIEIPPRYTVTFSLGSELRSLMNREGGPNGRRPRGPAIPRLEGGGARPTNGAGT